MKCNKLLKEALDSIGIEFTYKLDDTLNSLSPKQKFSAKQLEGFLKKKGVSPREIAQSGIFKGSDDSIVMTVGEWQDRINRLGNSHHINRIEGSGEYKDITLSKKGGETPTYKETLSVINKPQENAPSMPHFSKELGDYNTNANKNLGSDLEAELESIRKEKASIEDIDDPRWPKLISKEKELRKQLKNLRPREKTLLGWNRTHVDTINGKPTTVLNEFQSDWAQTERAGRGTFKSSNKDLPIEDKWISNDNLYNYFVGSGDEAIQEAIYIGENGENMINPKELAKAIGAKELSIPIEDKWVTNENLYNKYSWEDDEAIQDAIWIDNDVGKINPKLLAEAIGAKKLKEINKEVSNIVADFPMSEQKHHQYQIVEAIDQAIKNGTNRIAIPIERENELMGSSGVTKFYDSLNKKILPDIRKKLEKQGMRIKISKEDIYDNPKELDRKIEAIKDELYNELDIQGVNYYDELEGYYAKGLIKKLNELQNNMLKPKNTLHILDIEPIKGKKVRWDVYSLLGAIGLGELADKLKNEEDL